MIENYNYIFATNDIKIYSSEAEHPIPHRLDGPAIEFSDGKKIWAINGKRLECSSQEEFERIIGLKIFW